MCKETNTEKRDKIINIQTGELLDWDRVDGLKGNTMLKTNSELWIEWDFETNDELGIDIWKATRGMRKHCNWICKDCRTSFNQRVRRKISSLKCKYCISLMVIRPDLASEWHPTKNGELTPHDVTYGSKEIVWWIGECRHEFDMSVGNRCRQNSNCPYCCKPPQRLLVGFNDMWTTNPELASQLLNPEDGYKYFQQSNIKVDWKCLDCEEIVKNKDINRTYTQGLSCSICSDGISFPEKFMNNLMKRLRLDYCLQKSFSWSEKRVYDFYLEYEGKKIIIETHGGQHYEEGFGFSGGRTLIEEQENDRYKEHLARENGIDQYIIIDCRYSELSWINDNILVSRLIEMFDLSTIDWNTIDYKSRKSTHIEFLKLWNMGYSTEEISNETNSSKSTISRALNKFSKIGLCEYGK